MTGIVKIDVKFRENSVVKNKIGFVVVAATVLLLFVSFRMKVDEHRVLFILPTSPRSFSRKIIEEKSGKSSCFYLGKMNTAGRLGSDCTLCHAHLNENERSVRFEN